jgi:D-glycero-D-manno-heptose 1,7-bisphosphate phosphatase
MPLPLKLDKSNHEKKKAVFLDRDGVINKAVIRNGLPYPPARLEEVEVLPGVVEALLQLKGAGYLLIVITNQPDVARGSMERETVELINCWLMGRLPLDEIRTCYHDDGDKCHCRKPKPGGIFDATQTHSIDLSESFMVGDRWRDIAAGEAAGCRCIFIDYGYAEQQPENSVESVGSLFQAAQIILKKDK